MAFLHSIFHSVFKMLQQPLAVVAWEGGKSRFEHANEAFVRLSGLKEDELRGVDPYDLFTSWSDGNWMRAGRAGTCSCMLRQSLRGSEVRIRLTWSPIPDSDVTVHLLTAEDMTVKSWIDQMAMSQEIIFAGTASPDFIIDRFERQFPVKLMGIPVERESVFAFFEEMEAQELRRTAVRIAERDIPETIALQTKVLNGSTPFEVELTICPFYDGDGSLSQYGFVVSRFTPVQETVDPSVALKVLMAKNGISAQQLSEATGISMQTISKLRNGKINKPQRLTAELIAAELKVAPAKIWPRP